MTSVQGKAIKIPTNLVFRLKTTQTRLKDATARYINIGVCTTILTIGGFAVAAAALWAGVAALELQQWTASKDYYEYCQKEMVILTLISSILLRMLTYFNVQNTHQNITTVCKRKLQHEIPPPPGSRLIRRAMETYAFHTPKSLVVAVDSMEFYTYRLFVFSACAIIYVPLLSIAIMLFVHAAKGVGPAVFLSNLTNTLCARNPTTTHFNTDPEQTSDSTDAIYFRESSNTTEAQRRQRPSSSSPSNTPIKASRSGSLKAERQSSADSSLLPEVWRQTSSESQPSSGLRYRAAWSNSEPTSILDYLPHASNRGDTQAVREILANIPPGELEWTDSTGQTALHYAIRHRESALVQSLITIGLEVNKQDRSGATALHRAVINGDLSTLQLLLENSADVSYADCSGRTALHYASKRGNTKVMDILLLADANPHPTDLLKRTALHDAAQLGHMEAVQLLLKNGAHPELEDITGQTALDLALESKQKGGREVAKLLQSTNV